MRVSYFRVRVVSEDPPESTIDDIRRALSDAWFDSERTSVDHLSTREEGLIGLAARSVCDVCVALGLGPAERENAHPHRLGDVLGVLDQTT